jgi:hypothetical protein
MEQKHSHKQMRGVLEPGVRGIVSKYGADPTELEFSRALDDAVEACYVDLAAGRKNTGWVMAVKSSLGIDPDE